MGCPEGMKPGRGGGCVDSNTGGMKKGGKFRQSNRNRFAAGGRSSMVNNRRVRTNSGSRILKDQRKRQLPGGVQCTYTMETEWIQLPIMVMSDQACTHSNDCDGGCTTGWCNSGICSQVCAETLGMATGTNLQECNASNGGYSNNTDDFQIPYNTGGLHYVGGWRGGGECVNEDWFNWSCNCECDMQNLAVQVPVESIVSAGSNIHMRSGGRAGGRKGRTRPRPRIRGRR